MHLLLDEKQMHLLKTYSATLDPLGELSSAKSREDYVTASAVLLVVYFIEKIIIDAESRIKEAVTSSDNTTASASNSRFHSIAETEQVTNATTLNLFINFCKINFFNILKIILRKIVRISCLNQSNIKYNDFSILCRLFNRIENF